MRARVIATSFLVRLSLPPLLPISPQSAPAHKLASVPHAASAMSTTATSATPPPPAAAKNNVRVVSYNLLSSKLARPSHFTHSKPEHLEFDYRLPQILDKLDEAMNCGFGGNENDEGAQPSPPTIFALQEVCYPFASALHAFFAQRGYHFVTGLYGRPFNGYMGVGIAYPLKDFETVNVDICRLSDERPGGWPREKVEEEEGGGDASGLGKIIPKVTKTLAAIAEQIIQTINNNVVKRLGYAGKKEIDPWEMSERRFNILLTAILRYRTGECCTFSISNYHMPCAFYAPPVMNIHAEMAAKRVQDLAAEQGDKCGAETISYIFAGDFNILPDSPHYELLTTGKLDRADPTYPPPKHGEEWTIGSLPMDSAYALEAPSGAEPEFTNYAHVKEDAEPFIGTLDYIFLSRKEQTCKGSEGNESGERWVVRGVRKLPCKEESGGPFPNEKEPSDHYLISADLELVSA